MAEKKPKKITKGLPILTILILFVSVLSFVFPAIASVLIFDRNAVAQGEVWRFFSCHLVHFTETHLAYNLLAFGVAGWIIERRSYFHFVSLNVLMGLAISISLFILKPAMIYYGGLSGMACGSIFYWALLGAEEPGPLKTICKLMIFFLPVKITMEIFNNASILPYSGQPEFVPMPASHIAGTAVALLFYIGVKNNKIFSNHLFKIDRRACGLPPS